MCLGFRVSGLGFGRLLLTHVSGGEAGGKGEMTAGFGAGGDGDAGGAGKGGGHEVGEEGCQSGDSSRKAGKEDGEEVACGPGQGCDVRKEVCIDLTSDAGESGSGAAHPHRSASRSNFGESFSVGRSVEGVRGGVGVGKGLRKRQNAAVYCRPAAGAYYVT